MTDLGEKLVLLGSNMFDLFIHPLQDEVDCPIWGEEASMATDMDATQKA